MHFLLLSKVYIRLAQTGPGEAPPTALYFLSSIAVFYIAEYYTPSIGPWAPAT